MKKNYIWVIFLAAIIIPMLMEFNMLNYIFVKPHGEQYRNELLSRYQLYNWIKDFFIQSLLIALIGIYNYKWKELCFPSSINKHARTALIVAANFLLYFIIVILDIKITEHLAQIKYFERGYPFIKFSYFNFNFFLQYIAVVIISVIIPYLLLQVQRNQENEKRNAELQISKAKAELSTLKEQISPHFFFNTLSSLSSIIRKSSKEEGIEFIQEMSNIYRYSLSIRDQDLVCLNEELNFIQSYVYLLKKRFDEKFQFQYDIPSQDLKRYIPPMALQLLIENCIQHNIMSQKAPLTCRVFVEDNMLCVENNFNKRKSSENFGMGLNNLGTRYQLLAKKDIIIHRDENYFTVKLPLL